MKDDILHRTFQELGFPKDFCDQCELMSLVKLEDVFLLSPDTLLQYKGFSYQWLLQLLMFLKERELIHLLQTTPGKY